MSLSAEDIAEALSCERAQCRCGKKEGAEWIAHCPSHDDTDPSLSLRARRKGGNPLVRCHAGCDQEAVIAALIEKGLWEKSGLTVEELAEAKKLPVEAIEEWGVADWRNQVRIPYLNEGGEEVAVRSRLNLSGKRFKWRRGDKAISYGLHRLGDARRTGRVLIVEGESDVWTLWHADIPAIGVPGANTWKPEWASHLEGIDRIYLFVEPDGGGDALSAKVSRDIPDVLIIAGDNKAKDPSEIWLSLDGDINGFRRRMQELMDSASAADEIRKEEQSREAEEALVAAGDLPGRPDLLEVHADAIRQMGYAGDPRPPLLVRMAEFSRLLERPLNLALVAPSAAGKNAALNAGLALAPAEAYQEVKASSPRALIYSDADFQHRTIVMGEADSIPDDGPAASAIRSLAEDQEMTYEVVEKGEDGRHEVRRITKLGPTNLLTTSCEPLSGQMWTRTLEVSVSDSPDQTRAVLMAHAASVNGLRPAVDVEPFIALERWIELAGERRVTVPFSDRLAGLVPVDLVRMRRDFRQLLTLIQAVALLYQRQRQRDGDGRIVAGSADYAAARWLLEDVFTSTASGGVGPTIRETVMAVREIYDGEHPVTVKAVGDHLGLSRDTAWYRVQKAIKLGYLGNAETGRGRPAKLVPGDLLPVERPVLPTVEEVFGDRPEPTVETRLKTDFQPQDGAEIDTESASEAPTVERLNGNPEGTTHTRKLPFMKDHIKPIVTGTKTQTARTRIDGGLTLGSVVKAVNGRSQDPFAVLLITGITKKRLGDFDADDLDREGGYRLDEFKSVWRKLHRGSWNPDCLVNVIQFRLAQGPGEDVCVSIPETDSTVQPSTSAPICAQSEATVERAVESGIQLAFDPFDGVECTLCGGQATCRAPNYRPYCADHKPRPPSYWDAGHPAPDLNFLSRKERVAAPSYKRFWWQMRELAGHLPKKKPLPWCAGGCGERMPLIRVSDRHVWCRGAPSNFSAYQLVDGPNVLKAWAEWGTLRPRDGHLVRAAVNGLGLRIRVRRQSLRFPIEHLTYALRCIHASPGHGANQLGIVRPVIEYLVGLGYAELRTKQSRCYLTSEGDAFLDQRSGPFPYEPALQRTYTWRVKC